MKKIPHAIAGNILLIGCDAQMSTAAIAALLATKEMSGQLLVVTSKDHTTDELEKKVSEMDIDHILRDREPLPFKISETDFGHTEVKLRDRLMEEHTPWPSANKGGRKNKRNKRRW